MFASVSAFVIRNIQNKFITTVNTKRSIAFLWIVFEPLLHIGIWLFIRNHTGMKSPSGLSTIIFILLGALPFLYFRDVISKTKSSIKSYRNYYMFRQVKPVDPIIASILSHFFITCIACATSFIIYSWFGGSWHVYLPLQCLFSTVIFLTFMFGLSLSLAVICFFIHPISIIINMLMRLMYLFSGIFFSAQDLPESAKKIFYYNPVFQFIEALREAFTIPGSYIPFTSYIYMIKSALVSCVIGLSLYVYFQNKIMVEIQQR